MAGGFFTSSDGARINYRFDGPPAAPVLMLAHSLGATLEMWTPQVDALTRTFRLLRYDSRGHGSSDVPAGPYSIERLGLDALELVAGLEVGPVHFCGLSMGGMVGQWLGIHASAALRRLILSNTAAILGPPEAWQCRIDTVLANGMGAISSVVLERWFSADCGRHAPGVVQLGMDMLLATAAEGYAACCAAIRDMDQRPGLPSVRVPTLVLAGSLDVATPARCSEEIARCIPGARLETLHAAHLSNLECPSEFNQWVLDFLSS